MTFSIELSRVFN